MSSEWKHTVPTTGAGQATFSQCWLASFKMLYKFHNQPVSLIEQRLRGAGIDYDDALENGLSDKSFAAAGTSLNLTMWSGEKFKQPAGNFDVGDSDGCEAFVEELKKGPLWVSRYIA